VQDEEADYIFYPEFRAGDGVYTGSEGEGEKTPRDTMSPTVAFEMGPAVQDDKRAGAPVATKDQATEMGKGIEVVQL
jgi:hypothetical protein